MRMGVYFMLKQPRDRKQNQWWLVLLLAPFVGVLWVPLFNAIEPKLWGIPFFFWYQFLWVAISAIVTALVYFKVAPKPHAIRQDHRESRRQ
jgi:membrane protein implicated in regulation of membrane protease activity